MLLDDKYSRYLWHYRTGRVSGPSEYSYKNNGYRVLYGAREATCQVCGEHDTNWFIIWFNPRERFRKWEDRKKVSSMVCSVECIDVFLANILMEKVQELV